MKLYVVPLRDQKLDAFSQPWFSPATGAAIRAFGDHVNEPGSPAFKHPEDYELFLLGTFDDQTGKFDQAGPPTQLAIGSSLVKADL